MCVLGCWSGGQRVERQIVVVSRQVTAHNTEHSTTRHTSHSLTPSLTMLEGSEAPVALLYSTLL